MKVRRRHDPTCGLRPDFHHLGDAVPPPGQAHVYRITATQQGQVFGGYTVVLLG